MQGLSDDTKAVLSDLAQRYQLSDSAVQSMLLAVKRGHGTMAQFDIGELGGHGQWMRGGMTMVGDMFNHGLKNTVDNLCNDLAQALSSGRIDVPGDTTRQGNWWPQWLGVPSSTGAQNDGAYAVFPSQHCLAIKDGDGVTLYDTQDHLITGVGQQQGSTRSQTFNSQRGSFSVSSLRQIDSSGGTGHAPSEQPPRSEPSNDRFTSDGQGYGHTEFQNSSFPPSQEAPSAPVAPVFGGSLEEQLVDAAEARPQAAAPVASKTPSSVQSSSDGLHIVALIEKLAALRTAGILSEEEFSSKKAELLGRL